MLWLIQSLLKNTASEAVYLLSGTISIIEGLIHIRAMGLYGAICGLLGKRRNIVVRKTLARGACALRMRRTAWPR